MTFLLILYSSEIFLVFFFLFTMEVLSYALCRQSPRVFLPGRVFLLCATKCIYNNKGLQLQYGELPQEYRPKLARTFDWKNQHRCSSFEFMPETIVGEEECGMNSTGV